MTLYALDDIDDAIEATRALLWPVGPRRWAKLALVAFFVGGVGGGNPFQFATSAPRAGLPDGLPVGPGALPEIPARALAVVLLVVAAAVVLGLLFLLVGSVMEFVLVESLRRETVALRRYWGAHWRRGLRLFGFRLAVGVVSLVLVGGLVAVVLLPVVLGAGGFSVALLLLAVPVFLVVALVSGIVEGFTTVFVVPVMLVEDCGVLAGWRRFWPTLAGQWKQYAAYAGMGFVLQLAAGLVAGIAILVAAIALAVPFAIVGAAGVGLLSLSQLAGWAVVAAVVGLYVLAMLVVVALVAVPVQVFLRYYALFVLGDTAEAYDLVAERRAALRDDGT